MIFSFDGNNSSNKAKGGIDPREVVSVRPAENKKLPNGRGVGLESSSGKVRTIGPEGGDGWIL